ncbi:hypothetical protein P9112_001820 [Eukaryota sp. TZLM1-RC]
MHYECMLPVFQMKSLDELQMLAQSLYKTTQQSHGSRSQSPDSTTTNDSPLYETPSFPKKPLIRTRRSSKSPMRSTSPSRASSVSPLRSPPHSTDTHELTPNVSPSLKSSVGKNTSEVSPSTKSDHESPHSPCFIDPSSSFSVNSPTPVDQPSPNSNPNCNSNPNPNPNPDVNSSPSAHTDSTSPLDVLYRCLSPLSRHRLSATEKDLTKICVDGDDPIDVVSRLWNELETSTFRLSNTNPNPNCNPRPLLTMRTRMDSVSQEIQTETMTSCEVNLL